jgi:hypothetical protein
MSTEPESPSQFTRFAQGVKSFEKTIYGLVVSSFIFSGIGSLLHADPRNDPGLAAMTTLLGTVAGVAGVLVTFVGWTSHPLDQHPQLIRFRATQYAWRIGLSFLLSIAALYAYFDLFHTTPLASVGAFPIATFFFFRGLVTGFLVARDSDAQQRTWDSMTTDKRAEWATFEAEEKRHDAEMRARLDEMRRSSEDIKRQIRKVNIHVRDMQRRQLYTKIRRVMEKLHTASMNFRFKLAGGLLLLPSERLKRTVYEWEVEEVRARVEKEIAEEAYLHIKDGTLQALPLETTKIEVYNSHAWHYFFITESLNESGARELLNSVARFRDPKTGNLRPLMGFVEGAIDVSVEARDCLHKEGVKLFRTSNWQPI